MLYSFGMADIDSLPNLGPKTVEHFAAVGITTAEQIQELGTEAAFEVIYNRFAGEFPFSSVYLYALEGAIHNCDWRDLPEKRKTELKDFFHSLSE